MEHIDDGRDEMFERTPLGRVTCHFTDGCAVAREMPEQRPDPTPRQPPRPDVEEVEPEVAEQVGLDRVRVGGDERGEADYSPTVKPW